MAKYQSGACQGRLAFLVKVSGRCIFRLYHEFFSWDEIVLDHVKDLAREHGAELTLLHLHRIMKADGPYVRRVQTEVGSAGYRAKQKADIIDDMITLEMLEEQLFDEMRHAKWLKQRIVKLERQR